jgi:hypothetical protein
MTEPSPPRPVPGPLRPAAVPDSAPSPAAPAEAAAPDPATDRFAELEQRPLAEHVAAYEAEHDRLQRELGTIDQL